MSSDDSITFNGTEYDPEVVSAGIGLMRQSAASNARGIQPTASGGLGGADISGDATIERWVGSQYDGERDIQTVLGYPNLDDNTSLEQYRAKYEYQDIASRIVDAFPEETWRNAPEVVDVEGEDTTAFEQQANDLIDTRLNGYWRRLDRAQRLGEYGLMVIGFADGQDLSEPVQASALSSPDDIAYFNIFPQEQVENWELGKDSDRFDIQPTDERYNKPVEYLVDFSDIDADTNDDDFEHVHWSRVIHVAEGALETDLKGEPALKKVFYRLEDRMKVIGASAEMFWSGADEKIIANAKEDFALQQYDDSGKREDFKEQLNALIHDMQKYMVSSGMEFEVIGGQEVDPTGVIDAIDTSIATAVGMPKNKLRGNETGERATTQDRNNWFDTISSRQTNLGAPQFVRQTLDRLLTFGVLPEPVESDYGVDFPSLFEESDSAEAETQNQRASMLQASGLAMTLSSEQKLTFLQEGPGAVDMSTETRELPVDESDPDVQRGFNQLFEQVALTPPESVQEHAQDVLDWRDDPDKDVSGMTDTGWSRAEQLASGEELSPSDVQEIFAWFARHGADEYELNREGMDPWRDNGRVAIKGWGGPPMRGWVADKREALTDAGELDAVNNALRADFAKNFTPELHPRDEEGKFTESGGAVVGALDDLRDAFTTTSASVSIGGRNVDSSPVLKFNDRDLPEASEEAIRDTLESNTAFQDLNSTYSGWFEMYGDQMLNESSADLWKTAALTTGNMNQEDDNPIDLESYDMRDIIQQDIEESLQPQREALRDIFGDSVPVSRGLSGNVAAQLKEAKENGESFELNHRTLESWSTFPDHAQQFAQQGDSDGVIITTEVPIERVFGSSHTSPGLEIHENEIIAGLDESVEYSANQIHTPDDEGLAEVYEKMNQAV